jgi:hypothetical protein
LHERKKGWWRQIDRDVEKEDFSNDSTMQRRQKIDGKFDFEICNVIGNPNQIITYNIPLTVKESFVLEIWKNYSLKIN